MKFTITIPRNQTIAATKKVISAAATNMNIKGFRKGKAPLHLVKDQLDPEKVLEEAVKDVLPREYSKYIKKNNLKPISNPKVSPKSIKEGEDWEFQIEIAQKPKVTLGDYQKAIKNLPSPSPINKPIKDPKTENNQPDNQKRIQSIYDILLKTCKLTVPKILIEQEVNRSFSNLASQVAKLGLTVEKYLESINKDIKSLRQEYEKQSQQSLKIEFILDTIASTEKLLAKDTDLQKFLKTIKDPQTKQAIKKDKYQQSLIKNSITKQKIVDYLTSL